MKRSTGKKTYAILLAGLTVLAAAGLACASGGEGHGGGGIPAAKWWDLLWRTMNFAGLVAILMLTLKKPIANGLAARRQGIIDQFEDLEARRAEAERKYREYESRLGQIDAEVQQILSAAVAQGEVEKTRIIDEATRAAEDIRRQAEMAVQNELAEAKRELRNSITEQAAKAAEELVKKSMQPQDQTNLINQYLAKVGG
ncbi:MAG: ATP synthase F0 subunit B [Thermodesulfobacteriota bacterium]